MKIPQFTLGLLLLFARSVFASEAGNQEQDGKGHPGHGGPREEPPHEDMRGKKKLDIPNQKKTPQLGGTKYCVVFNDGSAPATMALTAMGLANVLDDLSVEGITSGGGCDDCCESDCMDDCDCFTEPCVTVCNADGVGQCDLVDTGGH